MRENLKQKIAKICVGGVASAVILGTGSIAASEWTGNKRYRTGCLYAAGLLLITAPPACALGDMDSEIYIKRRKKLYINL